jgi:hypothetical protein
MSEWRQFSRLPESPEYWHALRERIGLATQPLSGSRARGDRWLDGALAAAVVAAAVVVGLLILRSEPAPTPASFQAGLAPADPLAVELLNSERPPHISGLLPAYPRQTAQ